MEISPWYVLLLGMGTVFVGLLSIILLTKLMGALVGKKTQVLPEQKPVAQNDVSLAAPAIQQPAFPIADRTCFSAVVAAAVASYMGTDMPGLRIRSIKQLSAVPTSGTDEHNRFIAVITAAIATAADMDAAGLRVHSIRKIEN